MSRPAAGLLEPDHKELEGGGEALPVRADDEAAVLLHAQQQRPEGLGRVFLTLDIETLGLLHHKPLPPMTCACLYDGVTRHSLLFYGVPEAQREANAQTLLRQLDEVATASSKALFRPRPTAKRRVPQAPTLAGFNAVRFDLPFIARSLGVEEARADAWVAKCVDPFLGMRSTTGRTCKLQRLLDLNGLGSKTGSGADAITLARYLQPPLSLAHPLAPLQQPDAPLWKERGARRSCSSTA